MAWRSSDVLGIILLLMAAAMLIAVMFFKGEVVGVGADVEANADGSFLRPYVSMGRYIEFLNYKTLNVYGDANNLVYSYQFLPESSQEVFNAPAITFFLDDNGHLLVIYPTTARIYDVYTGELLVTRPLPTPSYQISNAPTGDGRYFYIPAACRAVRLGVDGSYVESPYMCTDVTDSVYFGWLATGSGDYIYIMFGGYQSGRLYVFAYNAQTGVYATYTVAPPVEGAKFVAALESAMAFADDQGNLIVAPALFNRPDRYIYHFRFDGTSLQLVNVIKTNGILIGDNGFHFADENGNVLFIDSHGNVLPSTVPPQYLTSGFFLNQMAYIDGRLYVKTIDFATQSNKVFVFEPADTGYGRLVGYLSDSDAYFNYAVPYVVYGATDGNLFCFRYGRDIITVHCSPVDYFPWLSVSPGTYTVTLEDKGNVLFSAEVNVPGYTPPAPGPAPAPAPEENVPERPPYWAEYEVVVKPTQPGRLSLTGVPAADFAIVVVLLGLLGYIIWRRDR